MASTTSVRSPRAVRVALPLWPESFCSSRAMTTESDLFSSMTIIIAAGSVGWGAVVAMAVGWAAGSVGWGAVVAVAVGCAVGARVGTGVGSSSPQATIKTATRLKTKAPAAKRRRPLAKANMNSSSGICVVAYCYAREERMVLSPMGGGGKPYGPVAVRGCAGCG